MPFIKVLPFQALIEASSEESIFDAVSRAGLGVPSACFGRANCGLCRVKIISGEAHLSPLLPVEIKHLGNTYHLTHLRLSCQARIRGDVTIDIPDARRRK